MPRVVIAKTCDTLLLVVMHPAESANFGNGEPRPCVDAGNTRPLWRWALAAMAPGLVFAACTVVVGIGGLFVPVPTGRDDESFARATISVIVVLGTALLVVATPFVGVWHVANRSRDFCRERGGGARWTRTLFIVGFGLSNVLLWYLGCGFVLGIAFSRF